MQESHPRVSYILLDARTRRVSCIAEDTHVQESGSEYAGTLYLTTGLALIMKSKIVDFLTANIIAISKLVSVGYDSTAENTGSSGDVIRLVAENLGRP